MKNMTRGRGHKITHENVLAKRKSSKLVELKSTSPQGKQKFLSLGRQVCDKSRGPNKCNFCILTHARVGEEDWARHYKKTPLFLVFPLTVLLDSLHSRLSGSFITGAKRSCNNAEYFYHEHTPEICTCLCT